MHLPLPRSERSNTRRAIFRRANPAVKGAPLRCAGLSLLRSLRPLIKGAALEFFFRCRSHTLSTNNKATMAVALLFYESIKDLKCSNRNLI